MQVDDRVLVRNITPRECSSKLKLFWKQTIYIIEEVKEPGGLVYSVREQDKPNRKSRTLHRDNIMPCHTLPQSNQYSTTKIDITSRRNNFKLKTRGNKTEEIKLSIDKEKTSKESL